MVYCEVLAVGTSTPPPFRAGEEVYVGVHVRCTSTRGGEFRVGLQTEGHKTGNLGSKVYTPWVTLAYGEEYWFWLHHPMWAEFCRDHLWVEYVVEFETGECWRGYIDLPLEATVEVTVSYRATKGTTPISGRIEVYFNTSLVATRDVTIPEVGVWYSEKFTFYNVGIPPNDTCFARLKLSNPYGTWSGNSPTRAVDPK